MERAVTGRTPTMISAHPRRPRRESLLAVLLLILQPILFYWGTIVTLRTHIPYDLEEFHLPLIAFIARCLRTGVTPLWDPFNYGGTPIHADITTQIFYPFVWLAILAGNHIPGVPLLYWVECLIPLHMALGGLFAFLLLRRMGLAIPSALLGGSAFQLGAYFASQAQHLGAICTAAWLPLMALAVYELRFRFRALWAAVLAFTVALTVLSGFSAATLVSAGAIVLFAGSFGILRDASWRMVPGLIAGALAGAAMSAVAIVPLWILTGLSIASERSRWHVAGGGLPLQALVSLVSPDHYHIFDLAAYRLPDNFTFLYAYCGFATLILILLAPFTRKARPIVFLLLTAISALWMLGEHTPVYAAIYAHLPRLLRGALYAEMALMAFSFFAAITAALVLDRLGTRVPQAILWAIVLLTSFDLILTGSNRPMNSAAGGPRTGDVPARAAMAEVSLRLRALTGQTRPPMRVDYTDAAFSAGIAGPAINVIPTPDGDNPFMLLRMNHLRHLFTEGYPWERLLSVNRFDSPLLNMLNVGFLAGQKPIAPEMLAKTGLESYGEMDGLRIYRNPHALPRFFLPAGIRRSASEDETLQLLAAPSFDPAEVAVVEGIPEDRAGLATGSVRVDRYSENHVDLTVSVDGPAFLATSEPLYPGWSATVNGVPQPFLRTNSVFRGLALEAGTSRIAMVYRPASLIWSFWFSALSFVCSLTVLLWSVPQRLPSIRTRVAAWLEPFQWAVAPARRVLWWLLPIALLFWLRADGLRSWFMADDFAWLGLLREVHGFRDLLHTLFAPAAQGTIRPWSERGFFLLFESLFGLHSLPFRVCAFLTTAADVALIAWITRRLTGSAAAGFLAAVFWVTNAALSTALLWSAAYNEVLCPLFLLAALALFIRYAETDRRIFWWCQMVLFSLGFGALEIEVVYPAIAAAYVFTCVATDRRRKLLRSIVPLACISVAYFALHTYLAPVPSEGPYAIHIDGRMFGSLLAYLKWSLLPPIWKNSRWPAGLGTLCLFITGVALALTFVREVTRRRYFVLFGVFWFLTTLAPMIPLPDHRSDYYLTIPVIGLAMVAAFGVSQALESPVVWRVAALIPVAVYFGVMIRSSSATDEWWLSRSLASRGLVLGVDAAQKAHPGKVVVLDGLTSELYDDVFGSSAFDAIGMNPVYLTPGTGDKIHPSDGFSKLADLSVAPSVLRHALAREQVVIYSYVGDHLREATEDWERLEFKRLSLESKAESKPDQVPRRVAVGNPLLEYLLGPEWLPLESYGFRWLPRHATLRLGGPQSANDKLLIEGFCPGSQLKAGPLHLSVSVDGHALATTEIGDADQGFRRLIGIPATLAGGSLTGKNSVEITLSVDRVTPGPAGQELGLVIRTLAWEQSGGSRQTSKKLIGRE